MEKIIKNKKIKKQTPSQSVEAFSVGDVKLATAGFISQYMLDGKVLEFATLVAYNKLNNPQLDYETLKQVFEETNIQQQEFISEKETDQTIKDIQTVFKKNKTEATYLLAKYIVQKFNIITIGEKEREMFIYREGMYYPSAENLIIFPEIQNILLDQVTKSAKTETYHKIADATSHPRSIFSQADSRYIPLKNGVYDFQTNTLLPHSPAYRFTFQFPITFDPESKCPLTEEFLDQVLNPAQRNIVEEWLGYYFYRNYIFKKAIIFVGSGDTGKTTLLEVVTHLLGRDNISSISLQKMTGDKFSAAHLYNKHGNLVDELSARDISDTGAFKMATGGGTVTGEYKFGNQFSFHNYSKFTFACNRIPDVQDTNDEAYFNRWMVVRFENVIKKVIPNFIDTLRTEEERSGLFNLAMRGLKRLLEQKKFSYSNNAEDTKAEMMRSGSSIAMFASDMLLKEFGATVTREEMYEAYTDYCQLNKLAGQTKEMLGRRLPDYTNYISDGVADIPQMSGKPKKARVWRNVKIKINEIEDLNAEVSFTNF